MENIPVPPYPGPPLESPSSEQQRAYSYQPAPHSQHTSGQQSPGPQYLSSLPMKNIPTPPYPGPPLDSELTSSFQQRGSTNQPVPQTQHTAEELPHGPQSLRGLPIENIPAPPYPGPPLNSQATSSVQQRSCIHQPVSQTRHTTEEDGPSYNLRSHGIQSLRHSPMENIPAPPYYGLPSSSAPQRAFTQTTDLDNPGMKISKGRELKGVLCQHSDSHNGPSFHSQHAKQSPACPEKEEIKRILYESMPLERKPRCDLKERVCSQEGVAQTHCAPVQMKNNGMGAFSMEKMSTSLPHNAALKRQDFTCVQKPQAELPPNSQKKPAEIKHTTEFKKISSTTLSMENVPVPPYPGPPLESSSSGQQRAYSYQPAPHSQHTSVQPVLYNPQNSPQPQHYSSLPMENISAASYPGSPLGFQLTGSVQQLGITYQSAPEIHPTAAEGALHNQLYSLQHQRAVSASTTQYPGHTMNLQPSQPVQELSSATSVSKYSYYSTGAVQPEVQMVQQGGTHVMVQPFPQPALMVRPASQPAVMVHPSPQPTVVVQPATPTVRVIQPQVFQAAANAIVYHRYY